MPAPGAAATDKDTNEKQVSGVAACGTDLARRACSPQCMPPLFAAAPEIPRVARIGDAQSLPKMSCFNGSKVFPRRTRCAEPAACFRCACITPPVLRPAGSALRQCTRAGRAAWLSCRCGHGRGRVRQSAQRCGRRCAVETLRRPRACIAYPSALSLQKLWDTVAPVSPEIVTLLQASVSAVRAGSALPCERSVSSHASCAPSPQRNSVTGEVLRILARGGMQAMEVLARAPMVGPLAEVASRVMAGIAEVRARKGGGRAERVPRAGCERCE